MQCTGLWSRKFSASEPCLHSSEVEVEDVTYPNGCMLRDRATEHTAQ